MSSVLVHHGQYSLFDTRPSLSGRPDVLGGHLVSVFNVAELGPSFVVLQPGRASAGRS